MFHPPPPQRNQLLQAELKIFSRQVFKKKKKNHIPFLSTKPLICVSCGLYFFNESFCKNWLMGVRHRHTPTTNVLGQSSKICRFSVPFHLIWLNMSHNSASAEQTMTSMLVQPELSHFTGRQRNLSCSAYSSNSVSCILFVFLFFFFFTCVGGLSFCSPCLSPLSF